MSTGTTTADQGGWGQQAANAVDEWNNGPVDPLTELDGFDTDGLQRGGGLIEVEGAYHLEVAAAELAPELNNKGRQEIVVRLVCLHPVPGQSPAGSAIFHHLEIPAASDRDTPTKNGGTMFDAVLGSLCEFVGGFGLFQWRKNAVGKEVWMDSATRSTKLQLSTLPKRLTGLQVIGRPKREEWDDKATGAKKHAMRFAWGRGISQIGDPQNAMTPINAEAAKGAGLALFVAGAGQPGPATVTANASNGSTTKAVAATVTSPAPRTAPVSQSVPAGFDDL